MPIVLIQAICLCLLSLAGCTPSKTKDAPATKQPINLLIAGDTAGWIVPCGCTSKQSGGLLRRGTLVSRLKSKTPTIVLDVGGAAAGTSKYQQLKLKSILAGEIEMGLAAHNIGASEAALGAARIRELAAEQSVPFISANVFDNDGQRVADPLKIVDVGGQSVVVIGVLGPQFGSPDLTVSEPRQAILNAIDELDSINSGSEPVAGIVVLAYLPRENLLELAKQLPEIDAIIGGPTGQTVSPARVGATLVSSATNKGKFVVQLSFDPQNEATNDRWSADVIEVDETLADNPAQTKNLATFHRLLGMADFSARETGLSNRNVIGNDSQHAYAGNAACVACHQSDGEHFQTTKHAIAWQTLKEKSSHVDPYCQQCHTVGYGAVSGFDSIAGTPDLVNVGCESCHGPSSRHVADVKVRTPYIAKDQCLGCHDRENSPGFEYHAYWSKIVHGAKIDTEEKP